MVTKIFEVNGDKNIFQSLSLKNFSLRSKQKSSEDNDKQEDLKPKRVKKKTKKRKSLVGKVNTSVVNKIKKMCDESENLEINGFSEKTLSIKKDIVEDIQSKLNKKVQKYNSNIVDCEKSLIRYEENLENLNSDEFKLKKVKDLSAFLQIKKNQALKLLRERKIHLNRALIDRANNTAQKELISAKIGFEKTENRRNVEFKIVNKDVNGKEIIEHDYKFNIINGVVDIYDKRGCSVLLENLLEKKCLNNGDLDLINRVFKEYPSTVLHIPYAYLKLLSKMRVNVQSLPNKINLLDYIMQIAEDGYEISAISGRSTQAKTRKDFKAMQTKDIKEFATYMYRKAFNKLKKYSSIKYRGVPDRNILKGGEFLFDGFGVKESQQQEKQYLHSNFHNNLYFDRLHLFERMKKYTFDKVIKRERKQELRKKEMKELMSYIEKVKKQKEKDTSIGKVFKSVDILSTKTKLSIENYLLQKIERQNKSASQKYYDKVINNDDKKFKNLDSSKVKSFCGYLFKVNNGVVDFRGDKAEMILSRLGNQQVYYEHDCDREKAALYEIFINYPKTLSALPSSYIKKLQDINISTYLNDKFIGNGLEYVRYLAEAGYSLRRMQGQKFTKIDFEDLNWLKNNSVVNDYEKFKLEQKKRKLKAEKRREQRQKNLEMKKLKEEQSKEEQSEHQSVDDKQQENQNKANEDMELVMSGSDNIANLFPTSADYYLPMY